MADEIPGACLCRSVRFTVRLADRRMGVCHCSMCRRWSGGVFMAVEAEAVEYSAQSTLSVYRSSDYGERVFCNACGSSLFWRMQDGSSTVVAYQALDDLSGFVFDNEIFVDEKPTTYSFANHTKKMTGAEFIAAMTGGEV